MTLLNRWLASLLALLLFAGPAAAQSNVALTAETAATQSNDTDILYTVQDPTGAKNMRKVTASQLRGPKDGVSSSDPTTSNDNTQGYSVGSEWLNTTTRGRWVATGVSTGAATWVPTTPALLSRVTTSGSQASVSFTSISQSYGGLRVRLFARGTHGATNVDLNMRFNNDTAANYDHVGQQMTASGTGAGTGASGATSMLMATIGANTAVATSADAAEIWIPAYTTTTFYKTAINAGGGNRQAFATGNLILNQRVGWWRSAVAITRIDIFPANGNFTDNSVVELWAEP